MTDYKWKRSVIDNLQTRAKWIDNYELACKDRDHLVSICNQKEVESKCLRWQVEKAIRVIVTLAALRCILTVTRNVLGLPNQSGNCN